MFALEVSMFPLQHSVDETPAWPISRIAERGVFKYLCEHPSDQAKCNLTPYLVAHRRNATFGLVPFVYPVQARQLNRRTDGFPANAKLPQARSAGSGRRRGSDPLALPLPLALDLRLR